MQAPSGKKSHPKSLSANEISSFSCIKIRLDKASANQYRNAMEYWLMAHDFNHCKCFSAEIRALYCDQTEPWHSKACQN
jgi:hypothetical protein